MAIWASAAAHASGPVFAAVFGGSGQDYAASVASDAAGNTYVAGLTYSPDLHVTPGVFQTVIGGNGTLSQPSGIASDAFVAKFGPDGSLLWATFLGGSGDDYATGVGVDAAGNVLVTGWTRSSDFPVLQALQPKLNNGVSPYRWDAFVSKFDPAGSKLIYSTYLGGPDDDGAYGLAVDSAGNAYVTGEVTVAAGFTGLSASASGFGLFVSKLDPHGALVYSFLHPNVTFAGVGAAAAIAADASGSAYVTATVNAAHPIAPTKSFGPGGFTQALACKLSPDGSGLIYDTTIGGGVDTNGLAIAVDRNGSAYVGGITTSVDFPLVDPLEASLGAQPLWKSVDGGQTWAPIDNLPFAFLQTLVVDPSNPNTLYAGTADEGLFKSTDGGATFSQAAGGIAGKVIQVLQIDPVHPQTLYAATGDGVTPGVVYKTVNGGNTWSAIDANAASPALQVTIDPQNANTVYTVWGNQVARKSTDGGATWTNLVFPGTWITHLAADPRASGHLLAFSGQQSAPPHSGCCSVPPHLWRSADGGVTWVQLGSPSPVTPANLTVDGSTDPSTVYDGLSARSTDGGVTWSALGSSPVNTSNLDAVGVDPAGTVYGGVYNGGIYASHDRGQSWRAIGSPVPPGGQGFVPNFYGIVPAGSAGTIYTVVQNVHNSGFVAKLSPDGSSLVFSTMLNGPAIAPENSYAAQPGVFQTQNWVSALAVDASGNVVAAGGTRSTGFPTAHPAQAANAGRADAFVSVISADGGRLNYSSYFGGSQDDAALAVALDAQGNLVFAGQTFSGDFPVPGGVKPPTGTGEAFVAKLALPAPPAIASVLNAASYQAGIEAGSWAMIQGSNLANTTRPWQDSDFHGNNLPTALDGVSVTIDGKPAFVSYVSPTQINVQVPSDSSLGTVNVVVDNNGVSSAPATAPLQATAPAFFLYPGSSAALATSTAYALVGNPAVESGAAPAHPGDILVLWGTGFGATTPPAAAGILVSGAPAAANPAVTVGGAAVPVLSTVLTTGEAGLYQVTIQLPANVPTGTVAIQASVGGMTSPGGITIFIEKP